MRAHSLQFMLLEGQPLFAFPKFIERLVPNSFTMALWGGTWDGTFCIVPKFRPTMTLGRIRHQSFYELRKGEFEIAVYVQLYSGEGDRGGRKPERIRVGNGREAEGNGMGCSSLARSGGKRRMRQGLFLAGFAATSWSYKIFLELEMEI